MPLTPGRRPYARARNRHPRPNLAQSPPAPITIVNAWVIAGIDDNIYFEMSGPCTGTFQTDSSLRILDADAHAINGQFGWPVDANAQCELNVVDDWRGHTFGWTEPPVGLVALGIPIAAECTVIIQYRP